MHRWRGCCEIVHFWCRNCGVLVYRTGSVLWLQIEIRCVFILRIELFSKTATSWSTAAASTFERGIGSAIDILIKCHRPLRRRHGTRTCEMYRRALSPIANCVFNVLRCCLRWMCKHFATIVNATQRVRCVQCESGPTPLHRLRDCVDSRWRLDM